MFRKFPHNLVFATEQIISNFWTHSPFVEGNWFTNSVLLGGWMGVNRSLSTNESGWFTDEFIWVGVGWKYVELLGQYGLGIARTETFSMMHLKILSLQTLHFTTKLNFNKTRYAFLLTYNYDWILWHVQQLTKIRDSSWFHADLAI